MQRTSASVRSGFLITLTITLLLSPSTRGQTPANDFLPLAVGNTWTYDYALDNDVPTEYYSS